jgi:peptidoglycan hydrolase-like protein with peptidoglycan-binding domain
VNRPARLAVWTTATSLVGGALVAAAVGFGGRDPAPAARASDLPPATTPVTRATLTQTQQVNGTLGYGNPVQVAGRGQGTLTWLPDAGTTVTRGQPVYKANNVPVPLFYGGLQFYRQLRAGDTGDDVKEVEENLAALGYTGFTVDKDYTAATATAVRNWQADLGVPAAERTGAFTPAAVVLAPGPMRVTALKTNTGDPANGPLLTYTGTTRTVNVALDVALQSLVKPGVTATITLPDRKTVRGTVSTVGTVATAGAQGNPATIDVAVTIDDQSALGTLDAAPVEVTLISAHVDNVLTVPVAALVALAEGGYGVQVVDGSTTHYVAVQTGMFANGRVEITGEGIAAGTLVGVPT